MRRQLHPDLFHLEEIVSHHEEFARDVKLKFSLDLKLQGSLSKVLLAVLRDLFLESILLDPHLLHLQVVWTTILFFWSPVVLSRVVLVTLSLELVHITRPLHPGFEFLVGIGCALFLE